jgi:hypothetical protein
LSCRTGLIKYGTLAKQTVGESPEEVNHNTEQMRIRASATDIPFVKKDRTQDRKHGNVVSRQQQNGINHKAILSETMTKISCRDSTEFERS